MGKVVLVTTNFTAGELTPRVWGRVDVARYANGAEALENVFVDVRGGAYRRWGTVHENETKDSTKRGRLVPFVFSREHAYIMEFGAGYIRFFKPGIGRIEVSPGVAYEVATPYTEQQVQELDFTQGENTMFIWHQDVPTRRLLRRDDDLWVLDQAPFNPVPFDEIGFRPLSDLTLSTTATGPGATATGGPFEPADVGREIWAGAGIAVITAYVGIATATINITQTFDKLTYTGAATTPAEWQIRGSPQATLTPSVATPVGAAITLTLSSGGWRTSDVGSFVVVNTGLVRITSFSSPTVVNGVIERVLNTTVAAPPDAWILKAPVWNQYDGYPSTGSLYQQRLYAAGTPSMPQTVWGSTIAEYFNFLLGVLDDEAFQFTISSDDVNPIQYLCAMDALVALTYSGEFTMEGGVEKPITPTNVRVKPRSNRGSAKVRPARVGDEELFAQRSARRVRALSYDADSGKWAVPDMSVLSDHIIKAGVTALSFQDDPGQLAFAVCSDGVLASATYDRDQDVVAWTRQITDGAFESVATIPAGDADETWVIVRREVDGATVRYVERLDAGTSLDSCIVGTAAAPGATVWTGLDHLEGKTVQALADGTVHSDLVVTGGQITLPRRALSVQIGLPYLSRIKLLPPEVGGPLGSAQGAQMDRGEVLVRFLDSIGGKCNGQPFPSRQLNQPILDSAPQPRTGLEKVSNLGWDTGESFMEFTQEQPLPWYILSVIRKFTANQG